VVMKLKGTSLGLIQNNKLLPVCFWGRNLSFPNIRCGVEIPIFLHFLYSNDWVFLLQRFPWLLKSLIHPKDLFRAFSTIVASLKTWKDD
jgi:hypothetical protein